MNFDIPRYDSSIEQLDSGVLFEVFGHKTEVHEAEDEQALVFGNPEADCASWSYHTHENADGIACLKYAIEQLTSNKISEEELCSLADASAYYDLETGISTGDMLHILESYDLSSEYCENTSLQELMEMLEEGKAICAVSSSLLEGKDPLPYEGFSADTYVQVIGIDLRDPLRQFVRLNVPFDRRGAGKVYDLAAFSNAWKAGNKSVIFVGRRN